ncbi:MAG TPA: hypothetical protein P5277_00175 [Candidatus Paceibacterota bacterium]|nr:hypothetical protein [Candidatus Paceibacterota bacterium]
MNEKLIKSLREKLKNKFEKLPPYAKTYVVKHAISPNMIFLREHSEQRILHPRNADEWNYEIEKEVYNCKALKRMYYYLKRRKDFSQNNKENVIDYINISFDLMKATNPLADEEKKFPNNCSENYE